MRNEGRAGGYGGEESVWSDAIQQAEQICFPNSTQPVTNWDKVVGKNFASCAKEIYYKKQVIQCT